MKRLLLFLFMLGSVAQAQIPTYHLVLKNDSLVNNTTYEFDIYLVSTSTTAFQLAAIQPIMYFNPAISSGTLHFAVVAKTSGFVSEQAPTNVDLSISGSELRIASNPPPGFGAGTIVPTYPGLRMARFRLTSTTPFNDQHANIRWKNGGSNPFTKVYAYDSIGTNIDVTDTTGHLDSLANSSLSPLVITTTSPLTSGMTTIPYADTLVAGGGTAPYTWAVASGSLPPGLSLSSSGIISGIPTTAGIYTFSARVTDSLGDTVSAPFSVSIAQRTVTITASAGANGTITPSGTVVVNYGTDQLFTFAPSTGYHVDSLVVDGILLPAAPSYTFTNDTTNHTIRVSFAIDQFTITPSAGANGSISPSTPTVVNYGGSQAFNFTPTTGYHVDSLIVDGVSQAVASSYTFTNVIANHTIRVTFAITQFTITPSAGANGSISPSTTVTLTYGSSQAFTFTPSTGYHVDSLIVDSVLQPAATGYTFTNVTANHTIQVTFAINQYTISATSGSNGTISPSGTVIVSYGGSQTFNFNPSVGYHPDSVIVDGTLQPTSPSYTFTNDTSNHTIRVTFKIDQFTITPSAGANGSISPSAPTLVDSGGSQTFSFFPATGYHVDSIIVDGVSQSLSPIYTFSNVNADHTIRVTFAINQYTITASAGANGTITPSGTIVATYGSSQTFDFSPATGYHVDSLLVDNILQPVAGSYTFDSINANHTIRVTFAIKQFSIVASAGTNGTISPSGTVGINYGGSQAFTFTPSTGYHVDSLVVDGVLLPAAPSYTFTNDTSNHTIRVSFAINQFTITPSAGANGSIAPSTPTTVNYGSSQTFNFTPTTGYHVDSLIVDSVSQPVAASYTFVNVTANHTIRVTFAINQYTIVASSGANGTIAPSGTIQLTYGANQTFNFTPVTGYHVDSLIVDGILQPAAPSYTFTSVNANHTIRVTFAPNILSITVQTNPPGNSVTVDGTHYASSPQVFSWTAGTVHTISCDTIQAVTSTSRLVWTSWSDTGANTHSVAPLVNTTYTASFKRQFWLTMSANTGGTVTPASGWNDSGAVVTITAFPSTNYSFSDWGGTGVGSTSSAVNPTTIRMGSAITEVANFNHNPVLVTVQTNPSGLVFYVNGFLKTTPYTFSFSPGQSYTIATDSVQNHTSSSQMVYKRWSDNGAISHTILFPGNDTTFTAFFTPQYYLTVTAGTGGTVSPPNTYHDSGSAVQIMATPQTGYAFTGWVGTGTGSYTGLKNPDTLIVVSPITENATFGSAPIQVSFATLPPGLSVIVDSTHVTTPVTETWAAGSLHSIGVDSVQAGPAGKQYIWKSWSDGGARIHTVSSLVNTTFTATLGTQFALTMNVDSGGTVSPGTTFQDSAKVVSIQGTPSVGFHFGSWTGSGTGSYTGSANPASVTMSGPISETAHFVHYPAQVTVQTNVSGLTVLVDDTAYTSPHTFSWLTGSTHKISTTTPQPPSATTQRYVWNTWSDGGAMTHFVTPSTDTTFTANFGTQYYLTMTANTGGTVSPASNWYNAGQVVTIFAIPSTGYSFVSWTGSGTGSYTGNADTTNVTMNSPITEIASFNKNNVVVTVQTNPPGMPFTLGGPTIYYTTQTRSVPPGTVFQVVAVSPYSVGTGVQYAWTNWSDSGAQSHSVTALTDTTLTATFRKQFYLRMAAGPGGTVTPPTGWQDSGSTVQMLATPNTGYAFYRWYGTGTGSYNGIANPASVLMTGPFADSAGFSSFPISVTIQSNPSGRTIIVDGAADTVVRHLTWSSGTQHTIAVPDTQAGGTGIRYLWTSWSDSGVKSHSVAPVSDTTFTVSFRPQYFLTMNAGAGGTVTPASAWYDAAKHVVITAFPNPTYNFGGWNGTGTGSYTGTNNPDSVTMNGPVTETASFARIPVHVTIRTIPDSLFFTADTVAYKSPQTFLWELGVAHTIGVATPQAGAPGVQYTWKSWSDNGTVTHSITPQGDTTFTAAFGRQFYLTVAHDTGGSTTPASGWQDSGKAVTISALPSAGYSFTSWRGSGAGSYTGTLNPVAVTMLGPVHDTAAFARFQANVTFRTNPAGLQVLVDGAAYTTPVTIPWTTGATHTITAVDSQYNGSLTRYIWSTWSDSGTRIHTVAALRDTTFTANFTTQYYVTMTANPGGTVSPLSGWFNSGQVVPITAFPNSGYLFTRWTGTGTGSYSGFLNSASITVGSPITEVASFNQSAFNVTVQAVPSGRSFTVAGFTYNTPQTYSVTLGNNVFSIGAPSPQQIGAGTQYAWKSWSDSGTQNHTVTVVSDTTFTVYFGLQYQLTTTASPANSGATNPPNGTFFDIGDTAFVTAVANPHFAFVNWSGAISGSQNPAEVIMSSPKSIIANFGAAPQITVTSDTAGRSVTIDDSVYTTPAVVYWLAGTGHTINAMSPQPGTPGVQYVWKDWSDSGAVSHTVTTQRDTVFKASYRPQYYVTMSAGSGGGVSPASGWFSKDTTVTITATPAPGFAFVRWTGTGPGSYSGYSTQATITTSGPISETASFGRILAAPTLVSPADGSTGVIPTPVLVWHSYAGVSSYHIQIARDSQFTQLSVDSTLQTDTVFVAPPLPNMIKQYWRLNALVGANITLYSTVWSFTTIPGTITAIPPLINWATGFTYPITWASTTLSGGVNIKLSVDNGSTWRVLRANIPNSGITFWKVPDTMRVSNLSKFRVESALNPAIYGESVLFGIVSGALPSTIRLSTSIPYPNAPVTTDYRLVSIPGVVDTMSIGNLIGGIQGTDWRAFADNGAASNYLIELTENSRLTTGQGYWLVKKGTLTISSFLMALPHLDTLEARFSIPLHLGWNIIANPFDQNLPWKDVMTVNGLPTSTPLITYEGFYTTKSEMEPFTGYYFMNDTNTTLSSLVLPYPFGSVVGAGTAPVADWSVQVALETGTNKDPENYFGVGQSLKAGRNQLSYPKPPLFMDQAFLYFPHPEWDRNYPRFMTDIRPEVGSGQTWTFEVSNPGRTKGTLRFTGIEHVPAGQRVVLINEYNSRPVDLRVHPVYSYETVSERMQFRILVGPDAYVDQQIQNMAPERFDLAQNFPNPFNPSTAISVKLQHQAPIRLEIYSTLGQVVRTLADGTYPQGTVTFTWDGMNNEHRMVASGVYFYRLIADGAVIQTRKMILAR